MEELHDLPAAGAAASPSGCLANVALQQTSEAPIAETASAFASR